MTVKAFFCSWYIYCIHSLRIKLDFLTTLLFFYWLGSTAPWTSKETKWSEHEHLLFVYQGHSIQMGHQRCWRRTTVFLRGAATPTAGRSGQNLPPQMMTPTVWPGSTTLTWMPRGKSPPDSSGLCSPARKVWRRATTLRHLTWFYVRRRVSLWCVLCVVVCWVSSLHAKGNKIHQW